MNLQMSNTAVNYFLKSALQKNDVLKIELLLSNKHNCGAKGPVRYLGGTAAK